MKFTRFFSALLALAFMAACGGVSPTSVDDGECESEVADECFGGTMGSGG